MTTTRPAHPLLLDDPAFTYPTPQFGSSHATKHLRVWEAIDGATIAIITDTGGRVHEPSITNTAEQAHAAVWERLSAGSSLAPGGGPDGLTVVEHYPADPASRPGGQGEEFARIVVGGPGGVQWLQEPVELLLLSLGLETYPTS